MFTQMTTDPSASDLNVILPASTPILAVLFALFPPFDPFLSLALLVVCADPLKPRKFLPHGLRSGVR